MEYSLQTLNKIGELKNLKTHEIIDKLNLIGLEVDGVFKEQLETNKFVDNLRLEIAIPSNREDLLNEHFLINEFATIFDFDKKNIWENAKSNYAFLLKQKYNHYKNYKTEFIETPFESILNYTFLLKNLQKRTTPQWVKTKLQNCGVEIDASIINNIINLSILEWGQQINVCAQVEGNPLKLERLQTNTEFISNDNKVHPLEKGTVVLKNNRNQIINVFGIFNLHQPNTQKDNIYVEATFYDIQKNDLNLTTINTNLSYRYLRRIFLETFKYSLQRFLTLIEVVTGIKISLVKYCSNQKFKKITTNKILAITKNSAKKVLNIEKYNLTIFKQAGLRLVCETNKELYFSIPTSRKDLEREIDIIEEYSRFIGYHNFSEITPKKELVYYKQNQKNEDLIKQFFINYGFTEVLTNSIYDVNKVEKETLKLKNPLNKELALLRTSLTSNLINVLINNLNSNIDNRKFFEIGRTFKKYKNQIIEQEKLAAIFYFDFAKNSENFSNSWFEVKGFLEGFLENFNYKNLCFEPINKNLEFYHPTRSVLIRADNIVLGTFGEVHPNIEKLHNSKQKIYLFELNLNLLTSWKTKSHIINYQEFSKYPSITKDISIQIPKNSNLNLIKKIIKENTSNIKEIKYFDIYFDSHFNTNVNVGIRLKFQSNIETLRTENIDDQISKLLIILKKKFNKD